MWEVMGERVVEVMVEVELLVPESPRSSLPGPVLFPSTLLKLPLPNHPFPDQEFLYKGNVLERVGERKIPDKRIFFIFHSHHISFDQEFPTRGNVRKLEKEEAIPASSPSILLTFP